MLQRLVWGIFTGVLFFGLCSGAQAVELDPAKYDVYYGDINGDGRDNDVYFHGKELFIPIHGDILIPIILPAPEGFVFYEYGGDEEKHKGKHDDAVALNLSESELLQLSLATLNQDYFYADFSGDGINDLLVRGHTENDPTFMATVSIDATLPIVTRDIFPPGSFYTPLQDCPHNGCTGPPKNIPNYQLVHDNLSDRSTVLRFEDVNDDGRQDVVVVGNSFDVDRAYLANSSGYINEYLPLSDKPDLVLPTLVGTSEGAFRVSEAGAATYSMPISLPAGTAGAAPQVSISYSSQQGNGLLGQGWALNGGGSISRCRQTRVQDGVSKPLSWDSNDRFCLNGQRLVAVEDSTYGAAGSVYRTEIDSYVRVTLKELISDQPKYFVVEAKDGSLTYYGNTADSRHTLPDGKILLWAQNRFQDSAENKIDYQYVQNQGSDFRLSKISYAYGSSSTANSEVKFSYTARPDSYGVYIGGNYISTTLRLDKVVVSNKEASNPNNAGLQDIRAYNLHYLKSEIDTPYRRSYLAAVQECVNSTCLPATQFEWGINKGYSYSKWPSYSESIIQSGSYLQQFLPMDVNGDGYLDMVWLEDDDPSRSIGRDQLIKYSFFNKETQQFERQDFYCTDSDCGPEFKTNHIFYGENASIPEEGVKLYPLDYNADGRQDLVVYREKYSSWRVYLSRPVSENQWQLSAPAIDLPIDDDGSVVFMDVNFDGLADIVTEDRIHHLQRTGADPSSPTIYSFDPVGHAINWQEAHDTLELSNLKSGAKKITVEKEFIPGQDFNADGQADLIVIYTKKVTYKDHATEYYRNYYIMQSTGDNLEILQSMDGELTGADQAYKNFIAQDINMDGYADIIGRDYNTYYLRINNGDGFLPRVPVETFVDTGKIDVQLADINGDGYLDFFWSDRDKKLTSYKLWDSEGNSFGSAVIPPYADNDFIRSNGSTLEQHLFYDATGDGHSDYIHLSGTNLSLHKNAVTGLKDVVTEIKNGINAITKVDYNLLHNSDHYARVGGIAEEQISTTINLPTLSGRPATAEVITSALSANDFYRALNEPFADVIGDSQSLAAAYPGPVLEYMAPTYIVTRVEGSAPAGKEARGNANQVEHNAISAVEYIYEQAKFQSAGRGLLGFKVLTTIDLQTGVKTQTHYRQDWPFIQYPVQTVAYTPDNDILSTKYSEWALVGWDPTWVSDLQTSSVGTSDLEPIRPYIQENTETNFVFENNSLEPKDVDAVIGGALDNTHFCKVGIECQEQTNKKQKVLQTVTTTNKYDGYGNPYEITVVTEGGGLSQTQITKNDYDNDNDHTNLGLGDTVTFNDGRTNQYRALGRITSTEVETTRNNNTSIRESSFTYYKTGVKAGLLEKETIEPNGALAYKLVTTHDYGNFGNKTVVVTKGADITYDLNGDLSSSSDVERKAETVYDTLGRYVDETIQHLSATQFYSTEIVLERNKYGAPLKIKSNLTNLETQFQYDALGREIYRSDNTGAWQRTEYLSCAQANPSCPSGAQYAVRSTNAGGAESIAYFDVIAREIRSGQVNFNGIWSMVSTEYDKSGRLLRKSEPHLHGENGQYWTLNTYDILGRVITATQPDNSNSQWRYYGYSATVTNALGQVRTETKNGLGQLIQVEDHLGALIKYNYDDQGNLTATKAYQNATITDPLTITLDYDALGRKTSMDDPDKGYWEYRYNAFGELKWQRDAKGQVVINAYDDLGRFTSRVDYKNDNSVENVTHWYYDEQDDNGNSVAYARLQPTAVVHSRAVADKQCQDATVEQCVRYTYDQFGRGSKTNTYIREVDGQALEQYTTQVTYDSKGRVSTTEDVLSGLVTSDQTRFTKKSDDFILSGVLNDYNDYGYLEKTIDLATGREIFQTLEQNLRGQTTQARLGNLVDREASFDDVTGRIKTQKATSGSIGVIQDIDYAWDEVNNLKYRQNFTQNLKESFCYDGLNRLVKTHQGTTTGDCVNVTSPDLTYDNLGNIVQKVGVGSYQYGQGTAGPHAVTQVGSTTYSYDANGNMRSDSDGRSLLYTTFDKPYRIEKGGHTTEFKYGADRGRFWKKDADSSGNTKLTIYLGNVEKIIYGPGNIEWKRYIGGAIITYNTGDKQTTSSGEVSYAILADESNAYVLNDHLGSLDVIVDDSGAVVQRMSFDPWGQRRHAETWADFSLTELVNFDHSITTRGFTNHEMLDEVGLIHMNGRIYDARLGRFLQADPFIQAATNTQSYNRYSYAWNNPLNTVDPSGYFNRKEWKENRRAVFVTATVITMSVAISVGCGGGCAPYVSSAAGAALGAFAAAANGGTDRNILIAAISGAAMGYVGGTELHLLQKAALMGVIGGITSVLQGGKFGHGFLSAAIGTLASASNNLPFLKDSALLRVGLAAVVGGTVSEMTGGKFANGAATAAFAVVAMERAGALRDSPVPIEEVQSDLQAPQPGVDTSWEWSFEDPESLGAGISYEEHAAQLSVDEEVVVTANPISETIGGALATGGSIAAMILLKGKVVPKGTLNPQQAKNLKRFDKKKPANSTDTTIRDLPGGGKAFQADSAAQNIPGSFARFEKQIDSAGKTTQFTKTTFGPKGEIVHVKDKITGQTFTPGQ